MSNNALKTALKQRDQFLEVCQKLKNLCDDKIAEINQLEKDVEELKGYVIKEMKEGEAYRQFANMMVLKCENLKKENDELQATISST
tara:strand:+ start:6117 stop:6377 length:261 start_codon:yes stop_codon:yes gene_type:complete